MCLFNEIKGKNQKSKQIKKSFIRNIHDLLSKNSSDSNAIKDLIEQYEKTSNGDLLKMAIELQVKELNPEIHNLRLLKYEIMEMITNSNDSYSGQSQEISEKYQSTSEDKEKKKEPPMYYLYQRYASLFKSEYNIGKPPKVVHYNSKK